MRLRILALLSVLLFAASPALAADVRYPEKGVPAVAFKLPDGWSKQYDDDHNLLMASSNHSVVVVLSLVEYSGSLDYLATEALKVAKADPPTDKKAMRVAGLNGYAWRSHASAADGTKLNLRLMEVKIDPTHTFTCTLISALNADAPGLAPANHMIDGMKAVLK